MLDILAQKEGALVMISRRYMRPKRCGRFAGTAKLILLSLLIVIILLQIFVKPVVLSSIRYQSRMLAAKVLSDEISDILKSAEISYDSLVTVSKDDNGNVTAITTDIKFVNQIKSELAGKINNAMSQMPPQDYSISLGTLLGSSFMAGRGPSITMKIVPVGYVTTEIVSHFEAAGINQTKHQILLNIEYNFSTIIPLHKTDSSINTNFLIAETVIVGKIPQYYSNFAGENNDKLTNLTNPYQLKLNPEE